MNAMTAPISTCPNRDVGRKPAEWWLHWILRLSVASTFIGHGAFGIRGKEAWLEYYAVLGFPASTGWDLMPLTGTVDIALGILVLLVPMRAALLYMAAWGLFTALLRPLAGQGVFELVERSYNFGPPLALLLLHGWGRAPRDWFSPLRSIEPLTKERARAFALGFRVIIATYLIGHGALAVVMGKPLLLELYGSAGVGNPATLNDVAGLLEIALGAALLARRAATTSVLLFVLAWKLGSESLYIAHESAGAGWEVIERGGSYASPLALVCLSSIVRRQDRQAVTGGRGGRYAAIRAIARIASVRSDSTLLPRVASSSSASVSSARLRR